MTGSSSTSPFTLTTTSKTPGRLNILSSSGAESHRGRGTRVFEAVELDRNRKPNGSHEVLKDIWIDNTRAREGEILRSLRDAADEGDRQLIAKHFLTTICHGDVWEATNSLDDTTNTLMRGLDMELYPKSLFDLEPPTSNFQSNRSRTLSGGLQATSRVKVPRPRKRHAHRTHYRIVFKEKGIIIDKIPKFHEVLVALTETVSGAF